MSLNPQEEGLLNRSERVQPSIGLLSLSLETNQDDDDNDDNDIDSIQLPQETQIENDNPNNEQSGEDKNQNHNTQNAQNSTHFLTKPDSLPQSPQLPSLPSTPFQSFRSTASPRDDSDILLSYNTTRSRLPNTNTTTINNIGKIDSFGTDQMADDFSDFEESEYGNDISQISIPPINQTNIDNQNSKLLPSPSLPRPSYDDLHHNNPSTLKYSLKHNNQDGLFNSQINHLTLPPPLNTLYTLPFGPSGNLDDLPIELPECSNDNILNMENTTQNNNKINFEFPLTPHSSLPLNQNHISEPEIIFTNRLTSRQCNHHHHNHHNHTSGKKSPPSLQSTDLADSASIAPSNYTYASTLGSHSLYSAAATTMLSMHHFGKFIGSAFHAPQWYSMRYITTGFRINYSIKDALMSLFEIHNETAGIWSHVFGFVIFIFLFFYRYYHVLWALEDKFLFWCYVAYYWGSAACMLCSFAFHLFCCVSEQHHDDLYILDMSCINIMIIGNIMHPVYLMWYCEDVYNTGTWYALYALIFGLALVGIQNNAYCLQEKFFNLRIGAILFYGGSALIPFFHFAYIGRTDQISMTLWEVLITFGIYSIGVLCWIFKFPECLAPGVFDMGVYSHSIWHAAILIGSLWTEARFMHVLERVVQNTWCVAEIGGGTNVISGVMGGVVGA
jgi:adiponectin receptor